MEDSAEVQPEEGKDVTQEAVSEVSEASISLDRVTIEPETDIELNQDHELAEVIQTALVVAVGTPATETVLDPPASDMVFDPTSEDPPDISESLGGLLDEAGPTTEKPDSGIPPSDPISNVNAIQGPRSAEAQGPQQDGELQIFEDEIEYMGNDTISAPDVMARAIEDETEGRGDAEAQEALQPMEDVSILDGEEAPDSSLHESIAADLSTSGVSPEDSLRDIVNESETELGGKSKATGHGVFSKSREIPVSTTGEGSEPEAVMPDLSALGILKGSESEASEFQEQPVMDDLSIVAGVEILRDLSADELTDENGGELSDHLEDEQRVDEPLEDEGLDSEDEINPLINLGGSASSKKDKKTQLKNMAEKTGHSMKIARGLVKRPSSDRDPSKPSKAVDDVRIDTGRKIGDLPVSGESSSDIEIWEESEPQPPGTTGMSPEQAAAAMEEYQNKHAAWQAAKPPDEGDDNDRGTDRGSGVGEATSIPGGSVVSDATAGMENLKDSSGG